MHVELLPDDCSVVSESITTKDGRQMTIHKQRAYLWMPGAPYPLPFSLSINSPADSYSPGNYVFGPESVRTNQLGQIEFNRYGMKLRKAQIKGSDDKARAVNS